MFEPLMTRPNKNFTRFVFLYFLGNQTEEFRLKLSTLAKKNYIDHENKNLIISILSS